MRLVISLRISFTLTILQFVRFDLQKKGGSLFWNILRRLGENGEERKYLSRLRETLSSSLK